MPLPRKLFDQIRERDGGFCLYALPGCLGEGGVLDHRANRGSGGSPVLDAPQNLALCCSRCNSAKADAHAVVLDDLERRGLYIPKAATNTQTLHRAMHTPVQSLDGDWWLLISATERRNVTEEIERRRHADQIHET
jgi:hypothetical protein